MIRMRNEEGVKMSMSPLQASPISSARLYSIVSGDIHQHRALDKSSEDDEITAKALQYIFLLV